MSSNDDHLREFFLAASALKGDERTAYLDRVCRSEPELRAQLDALLSHHDHPDSRLEPPAHATPWSSLIAEGPSHPATIGTYRIVRPLGHGGMGVVYLAEQARPQRRVAVKLMRHGLTNQSSVQRFEREVEILGRLSHPGIATIFEASTHEEESIRRPFIAMEWIDGKPITEHARARRLDPRARVQLFLGVCDAIQQAHEADIVHRDLKPDNVLVTETGQPKVLDFGIARSLSADDQTLTQESTSLLGTLEFMSPEQANGKQVDVGRSSDVYSLGVLLYELLTDRAPFDFRGQPITTAIHTIVHEDLPPLGLFAPNLKGDLETIVQKATEKEPARRYDSASALADDLRRFLDDQPIRARPPGRVDQLRKYTRRHRSAVTGASIALLAIVVGAALAVNFALQSAADLRRAEQADRDRILQLGQSLRAVDSGSVPLILETLSQERESALPQLQRDLEGASLTADERLRLACALTALGDPQPTTLIEMLPRARADECSNLVEAFRQLDASTWDALEAFAADGDQVAQMRSAIVLLELGRVEPSRRRLALGPDLTTRVEFIEQARTWHGDLQGYVSALENERGEATLSGLLSIVGGLDPSRLPPEQVQALDERTKQFVLSAPSALVRSTALWARQQWGRPPLNVEPLEAPVTAPPADRGWLTTTAGLAEHTLTLVRVPSGVAELGGTKALVEFSSDLWMSDRETTSGMFREYLGDADYSGRREVHRAFDLAEDAIPACVSWLDAVLFCNWLSSRAGLESCYTTTGSSQMWQLDHEAQGYRLPTSAEYEYALRAGTGTRWVCGESSEHIGAYANLVGAPRPAGSRLPNPYGLFDLIGNRWEWCTDLTSGSFSEGARDPLGSLGGARHDARGGTVLGGPFYCDSSVRIANDSARAGDFSFRVVRRIGPSASATLAGAMDAAPRVRVDGTADTRVEFTLTNLTDTRLDVRAELFGWTDNGATRPTLERRLPPRETAPLAMVLRRSEGQLETILRQPLTLVVTPSLGAPIRLPLLTRCAVPSLEVSNAAPAEEHVLILDGSSALGVDFGPRLNSMEQVTLEFWVRGDSPTKRSGLVGNNQYGGFGFLVRSSLHPPGLCGAVRLNGDYTIVRDELGWPVIDWTHLALVYDGRCVRLYVDGESVHERPGSGPIELSGHPLYVGADPEPAGPSCFFRGAFDEVRVSSVARYDDAFEPARRFMPDGDTLLLLHFDQVVDGFHPDASGYGHHAWELGQPTVAPAER